MGRAEAKSTLVFYIKRLWEAAGLKWDSDNRSEVEGIIDELVDTTTKELQDNFGDPGHW